MPPYSVSKPSVSSTARVSLRSFRPAVRQSRLSLRLHRRAQETLQSPFLAEQNRLAEVISLGFHVGGPRGIGKREREGWWDIVGAQDVARDSGYREGSRPIYFSYALSRCFFLKTYWLPLFWAADPKGTKSCRKQRESVRTYVRPSVRPSPPLEPFRGWLSPLRGWLSPLRGWLSPLRGWLSPLSKF